LSPLTVRQHRDLVIGGAGLGLLWRVLAFVQPSPLVAIAPTLRLPMGSLGLLFLACGVWVSARRRNRWTTIFLLYAIGGAVHWGGSIGSVSGDLQLSVLFIYLAFTALSDGALLHLALVFPSDMSLPRWAVSLLYLPALATLFIAPFAGMLSRELVFELVAHLLQLASLMSLAAGFVFIVGLFLVDTVTRRTHRLPLVVACLIGALAIATLGAEGIGVAPSEAWNLAYGLVPLGLAAALSSSR